MYKVVSVIDIWALVVVLLLCFVEVVDSGRKMCMGLGGESAPDVSYYTAVNEEIHSHVAPDKAYARLKGIDSFLISPWKHMLWVLEAFLMNFHKMCFYGQHF